MLTEPFPVMAHGVVAGEDQVSSIVDENPTRQRP
jgi:hypothetical protein